MWSQTSKNEASLHEFCVWAVNVDLTEADATGRGNSPNETPIFIKKFISV